MSTRVKFLALLFISFGGISLGFILFMSTDYAKNEQAYFNAYPYIEIAARENINTPVNAKIVTASEEIEEFKQEIMPLTSVVQPVISQSEIEKKKLVITKDSPQKIFIKTNPQSKKSIKIIKKPEIKTIVLAPPSPAPKSTTPSVTKAPIEPVEHHQAIKLSEEGWVYESELAYEAYDDGVYDTAITHFERALNFSPDNRDIQLQLAYAYKKTGQNSKSINNFKSAIDQYDDGTAPFNIRREVEQLEDRLQVNGYVIYRNESSNARQLGADLTQSQAGVEFSYQPKDIGFDNGRKFQIYTRFLSGMEPDRIELNPDSYQAGIGMRIKPLADHNLVLSAERLFKVGDFARNDWMVRAGYSYDHGTDYREDKTKWWSYSLYLDAAMIDPADPDIFLTSQITGGYSMAIAKGLVLQPRLTALASWQKDDFSEASLIEAGPGMNLRYYFNDTKYEAYRSYIDLTAEYRIKLSGNSTGGSGPVVSLSVHF